MKPGIELLDEISKVEVPEGMIHRIRRRIAEEEQNGFSLAGKRLAYTIAAFVLLLNITAITMNFSDSNEAKNLAESMELINSNQLYR